MEKKDILELNKKGRHIDEGALEIRGKAAWYGRCCAVVMISFITLLNAIAENSQMNRQLSWVLLALAAGECFSYYKVRKRKLHLVFSIIPALILVYEVGKYMIAIGP